jgi:hypothetical protein
MRITVALTPFLISKYATDNLHCQERKCKKEPVSRLYVSFPVVFCPVKGVFRIQRVC